VFSVKVDFTFNEVIFYTFVTNVTLLILFNISVAYRVNFTHIFWVSFRY